jgi:hypothetical protein
VQLNVPRIASLLRNLFLLRGGDPAPEVADELISIVTLIGERFEHRILGGEFSYAMFADSPAVAGAQSFARLRVPPNSGRIVTIEAIILANPAASTITYRGGINGTAAFTSSLAGNATHRDLRQAFNNAANDLRSVAIYETGSSVGFDAGLLQEFEVALPAGGSLYLPYEVTLDSGRNFEVQGGIGNTAARISYIYRERPQEPTEVRK